MSKYKRDSNIELLRIISIFIIILAHCTWETNWQFPRQLSLKFISIESFWIGGKLGVNIFFLITGYFLTSRIILKVKPLLILWVDVVCYSWLIVIVTTVFNLPGKNLHNILSSFFPISFNAYWFITVYFFLYLVSPILNKTLNLIKKKEYLVLLVIGGVYLFLFSSFFGNDTAGTGDTWITGVYYYLLGGFIKRYNISDVFKKNILILIFVTNILLMIFSIIFVNFLEVIRYIPYSSFTFGKYIGGNSPFQLFASVSLFLLFLKIKISYRKNINFFASGTLVIYMLHTNNILKDFIFDDIFPLQKIQDSNFIILFMLIKSFIIFFLSFLLFLIVDKVTKKMRTFIINFLDEKISSLLKKY